MDNDIKFHKLTIEDRTTVLKAQENDIPTICGHNFVNLFIWREVNSIELTEICDSVVISACENKCRYFYFPIGGNNKKETINKLINEKHKYCDKVNFIGLTEKQAELLEEMYPHKYEFIPRQDSFDYVYDVPTLAELKGKHLRTKKQFIRRFKESNDWSWEYLTPGNANECYKIEELWLKAYSSNSSIYLPLELKALKDALDNFNELELTGILLKKEKNVVAYSIGSRLNNETIDCHFEKADKNIIGTYETIRWLFINNCCKNYKYINCEEDLGIEGLRKSKQSYHPIALLKQFSALEK